MKKYLLILLLWIFCSPITYANNSNKSQLRDPKAYEKELTKILKSLHSITSVPGFSMAVTHKGKLIASVGTGFTDLKNNQQVKPDTTFRLASVSKIIGATMLAELVVNGQLDPDKPISHYYPELDKKYRSITIRQLLSHSSGMPHYQSKDYDIYDSHFTSAIDAVKTLKNRDLLSRPGTQYVYSTHGYTLAGALYEKITKQPLSVSINNFITRWTSQASPAIENINALSASSSKLFKLNSHGVKEIPYGEKSYSVFGAGLYATASDLALFGAKVLEKSKLDESFQHLLFTPTKLSDGKFISSRGFKVGFGWRISKDSQGRTVYHHAGATPGARSVLAIFPEQEISIAFLSNSSWSSSIEKLVFALAGLYIDGVTTAPKNSLTFNISNKDKNIRSDVSCQQNLCYLTDSTTDFSNWLNTFNVTNNPIEHWPIFIYNTAQGQRLLMVNKVGIKEMDGQNNHFDFDTGRHQTYSIKISEKISDIK